MVLYKEISTMSDARSEARRPGFIAIMGRHMAT